MGDSTVTCVFRIYYVFSGKIIESINNITVDCLVV